MLISHHSTLTTSKKLNKSKYQQHFLDYGRREISEQASSLYPSHPPRQIGEVDGLIQIFQSHWKQKPVLPKTSMKSSAEAKT
jgi:hypothetical protein